MFATPTTPSSSIQSLLLSNLSQDISKLVKEDMDEDALMQVTPFAFTKVKEQSEKKSEKQCEDPRASI